MADSTVVTFSNRSWAEECAIADPEPEEVFEYVFSNGRQFNKES